MESTISEGEVDVKLLVAKKLIGDGIHGDQSKRGVAPAVRGDRRTDHDRPIHPLTILDLREGGGREREIRSTHCTCMHMYQFELVMVGVAKEMRNDGVTVTLGEV